MGTFSARLVFWTAEIQARTPVPLSGTCRSRRARPVRILHGAFHTTRTTGNGKWQDNGSSAHTHARNEHILKYSEGKCVREALPKEHANSGARPLFPVQSRANNRLPRENLARRAAGGATHRRRPRKGNFAPVPHAPPGPYHLTRSWFILATGGVWLYYPVRGWYCFIFPYAGIGRGGVCLGV